MPDTKNIKKTKDNLKYYAVKKGHISGIYPTWDEAKKQIGGYSGPIFKKFSTLEDAQKFMNIKNYESKQKQKQSISKKVNDFLRQKYLGLSVDVFHLEENTYQLSPINKMYQYHPDTWTKYQNIFYLFTDGSFQAKSKHSGYGIYLGEKCVNISQKMPEGTTNNKCELLAILVCFHIIQHYKDVIVNSNIPIKIISDSKYSIQAITQWMPNWKSNGWKTSGGTQVKNLELMKVLDTLYHQLLDYGVKVELQHQNSHTSLDVEKSNQLDTIIWEGNYLADELAKGG